MYQERVYCYELYHQLRCRWPKGADCVLGGEVKKGGHPYLGSGQRKPDFLVHAPGEDRNYVVVEVKSYQGARDAEQIEGCLLPGVCVPAASGIIPSVSARRDQNVESEAHWHVWGRTSRAEQVRSLPGNMRTVPSMAA